MSGVELLKLIGPLADNIAKPLSDKIQCKFNPSQLQKALNIAIESSNQLGEDLFHRCEPDSIPGFLNKFFGDVVIEEFQKYLNNEGTPQIDYLVESFKCLSQKYPKIQNFDESLIKNWMNKFVTTFISETEIYIKLNIAKFNYLNKLAYRLNKHHFVGMKINLKGDEISEKLGNIFVMPDVADEVLNSHLYTKIELDADFSKDISRRQAELFKIQQEKALLLRVKSEKRNVFPAQNLLDQTKYKGNKIVLLGQPGSGKTTLINYFALKLCQKQLEVEDLRFNQNKSNQSSIHKNTIPILIPIRDLAQLNKIDILEYIEEYVTKSLQITSLPNGCFKYWLEQGEAVILLDGLDEVAQESQQVKVVQYIESFLQEFPRNQVVITSRPAGYERGYFRVDGFPHYEIQAFDDQKIKVFISQWYESHCDDKEEALRQTKYLKAAIERQDRIKSIASNPLLLTIIALINRVGAELPRERYKLYESAIETLLISWNAVKDKKFNSHLPFEYLKSRDFKPLMRQIAYWIHSKGSTWDSEGGTLINQDDLIQQLSQCIKKRKKRQNIELDEAKEEAKLFLEYIQERAGILDVQGRNCYAFVHKTFQEYLTAEYIDDCYQNSEQNSDGFQVVLDSIRKYLHDPHWREVLLLLVAKQKSNKAANAIHEILNSNSDYEKWLHRDLFFAADCLAEDPIDLQLSDDDPSQEILEKLVELEVSDSPLVIDEIRQQVFETLCSLNETEFADDVLQLLKNHSESIDKVRFQRYRVALGEKQEAIEELLLLLKDSDKKVRSSTVKTLGGLDNASDNVAQQLLPMLKDSEAEVRFYTVIALGKLGNTSDNVVQQLLPLLKDNEDVVIFVTIKMLGELGNASDNVVEQLLPLLKNSEYKVRFYITKALSELGNASDNVVQQLLLLLKDSNEKVRFSAAKALGKLGDASDNVVPQLLILLKDSDKKVSSSAVIALSELGDVSDNVVQQLLPLLKDSDKTVRSSAVRALGELGNISDNIVQQLLPLLKDSEDEVRFYTAIALGELGDASDNVVQQLLPLLKNSNEKVRFSAVRALGELGDASDNVVQQLLPLLKDSEGGIRFYTVLTLGKLENASDNVVQQLLPLLKDSKDAVIFITIKVLTELGDASDNVVQQLLPLLKDSDEKSRSSAVRALGELGDASDNVVQQLLPLLKDSEDEVRFYTVIALSELENASDNVVQELLLLFKDSDEKVRFSAVRALGKLGNLFDNVVVSLQNYLEEEQNSEYKKYGIKALWNLTMTSMMKFIELSELELPELELII